MRRRRTCSRVIEAQIERFAPGFRDRILARHVTTPADLERRNPNLVGGDIGMGAMDWRQLLSRPTWRQVLDAGTRHLSMLGVHPARRRRPRHVRLLRRAGRSAHRAGVNARSLGSARRANVRGSGFRVRVPGSVVRVPGSRFGVYGRHMQEAQPSRTAMRVAMRRAAHQLFDVPPVLNDPLALAIVGEEAAAQLRAEPGAHGGRIASTIRAFMAVRSRLAEDELARAVSRGVSQYVILGAGLDTFAYRNPHPASALRVFEVDFAATQAWKRRKLAAAAIPLPASLSFVAVDFESESLAERLASAGLNRRAADILHLAGCHDVPDRRGNRLDARVHRLDGGGGRRRIRLCRAACVARLDRAHRVRLAVPAGGGGGRTLPHVFRAAASSAPGSQLAVSATSPTSAATN